MVEGGWFWPANKRKAHYFQEDGKFMNLSLCGKIGTMGKHDLEVGNDESSDNCPECMRRLKKLKEKEASMKVS